MPAIVNPRFNVSSLPPVINSLMRCKDKYTHKELNALVKPLQDAGRKKNRSRWIDLHAR